MYCCYRIAEHRSTIRSKNMNYPVAIHFVCSYFLSKMHLNWEGVIPSRRDKVDVLLSRRQHYWIHHLRTLPPHELNIDHSELIRSWCSVARCFFIQSLCVFNILEATLAEVHVVLKQRLFSNWSSLIGFHLSLPISKFGFAQGLLMASMFPP